MSKSTTLQQSNLPLPTAATPPGKQPPLEPNVWSESVIADAKRVCRDVLNSIDAVAENVAPIKNGPCGAPAPVRLISIGKKNPVLFKPAPTITCPMLAKLARWIDKGLQPLAEKHLDTRVASVRIMSSYSCRTRYGRKGTRMSEHAYANALDIGGFRMADNQSVDILKHWGPTKRDIAKAVAAENAEKLAREKIVTTEQAGTAVDGSTGQRKTGLPAPGARAIPLPAQRSARDTPPPRRATRTAIGAEALAQDIIPPLPQRRPLRQAVRRRVSLDQAAQSPDEPPQPASANRLKFKPPAHLGGPKTPDNTARALFLRGVHQAACRIFGTILGPEANEAHRNHFHFDMHPRRGRSYCE